MAPKSKADPSNAIIKLLTEKNRPYSATTLTDELHGEFGKTAVQKALDSLAGDGKITCKICGKSSKLYFANQSDRTVASLEELDEMDAKLEELRKKSDELKRQMDELRAKRDRLAATKTIDELRELKQQKAEEVQNAAGRRDELEELAQGISFDDAANIEKTFNQRCEQWKKRKYICRNIVDVICENMGEKPSKVYEDLELETDESNGYVLSFRDRKYTISDV